MGPMKITPTLILLLNFLLHGDKLQQIFNPGYWHALPAVIYYIGVISYLDNSAKFEKYYDRMVTNQLGRIVCESALMWVFLSLNFYGWIFIQRLIYKTVRAWLTKTTISDVEPLAIMWQPEPSWRDSSNSDNIAFIASLTLAASITACCLSSSEGWNKRVLRAFGRSEEADSQWPPMVWPWSRTDDQQSSGQQASPVVPEEMEEDDEADGLTWASLKRALPLWPLSFSTGGPVGVPGPPSPAHAHYAPLPDFIPLELRDPRSEIPEQQVMHLLDSRPYSSEASDSSGSQVRVQLSDASVHVLHRMQSRQALHAARGKGPGPYAGPGPCTGPGVVFQPLQGFRRQTPPWVPPPMPSTNTPTGRGRPRAAAPASPQIILDAGEARDAHDARDTSDASPLQERLPPRRSSSRVQQHRRRSGTRSTRPSRGNPRGRPVTRHT